MLFWLFFLLGTLAVIMASQAVISSSCSIIKQSQSLGCFPYVKVLHTTRWVQGSIYIPEVNWILMVMCLAITTSFRYLNHVAIAYGTTSTTVALITSWIESLFINRVWHKHLVISVLFFLSFGVVESGDGLPYIGEPRTSQRWVVHSSPLGAFHLRNVRVELWHPKEVVVFVCVKIVPVGEVPRGSCRTQVIQTLPMHCP
ncbi:hypothetical protein MLD38_038619 [Melastoma candidum]|uniref:Uncharacterized protein n=1 Tax=Melastoma candidum TaxID=119954 RepID=A0ACB9L0C4_9MYRT|nr:hypothetical protein MLD38_038619 [Melastoma candidum]